MGSHHRQKDFTPKDITPKTSLQKTALISMTPKDTTDGHAVPNAGKAERRTLLRCFTVDRRHSKDGIQFMSPKDTTDGYVVPGYSKGACPSHCLNGDKTAHTDIAEFRRRRSFHVPQKIRQTGMSFLVMAKGRTLPIAQRLI